MHPALASAPASFWYRCAVEQEPGERREVDTDSSGERVPSPDARVDVKHLELTVPRVSLELHLDQPGEAHGRQETSGGLDDSWLIDRLDVGTELAEITGKLARAPGNKGCQRLTVFAESRVRKLRIAVPWHDLLNHQMLRWDHCASLVVARQKRPSIARRPALRSSVRGWSQSERGLDDHGKRAFERFEVVPVGRECGPRLDESNFLDGVI